MWQTIVKGLGDMNFAVTLAAIGSAWGAMVAGQSAIGAWKKLLMNNKPATMFPMIGFVAAPLSQTIYGMVLRNAIQNAALPPESYGFQMMIGALGGLALGASAWWQGVAGAAAADAYGETGKGQAQYFMVLGLIESVAIMVMVFCMTALPKAG